MSTLNTFWFENVETRPHPWPGLNWVTSVIAVSDVKEARDLYVSTFGFVPIFDATETSSSDTLVTTRLRYRGANILVVKGGLDGFHERKSAPESTDALPPNLFYMYVDDVEGTYEGALKAGFSGLQEPKLTFWGDLRARLRCPNGYVWDIARRVL